MKSFILFLLLFLSCLAGNAQALPSRSRVFVVDTAFVERYKNDIITVYYDTYLKTPLCISYKLYKGGGDCSRAKMSFKSSGPTAKPSDYRNSGYDSGHLCNAEDFAYDCRLLLQTFTYYNCSPQTKELNRGIWRSEEDMIRRLSQKDSLKIYAGGIVLKKYRTIGTNVVVPDYYYKVVQSLRTKKILSVNVYSNTSRPFVRSITLTQLNRMTNIKILTK